jgi:hypothetical protein
LYIDKSLAIKTIELMPAKFCPRQINQNVYLPLEIHKITNAWYATETEQLFLPLVWEMACEAVNNQMKLV